MYLDKEQCEMNISGVEAKCPVFIIVQDVKVAAGFKNLEFREEVHVGNITWEHLSIDSI